MATISARVRHHHVEHAVITPTNPPHASCAWKVTASSAISMRGNNGSAKFVPDDCRITPGVFLTFNSVRLTSVATSNSGRWLAVAVGFDQGLSDSVDNVVKLVGAAGNIFAPPAAPVVGPGGFPLSPAVSPTIDGGGGGSGGGGDTTYPLPPGHAPIATPPPAGQGTGGMPNGAGNTGQQYNDSTHGVELTDQKLSQTLKDIFASNQASYDKVMGILREIEDKQKQMGPGALNTPGGLLTFQKFVDDKLGEVQRVLDDAHVDSAKQSEVLWGLSDEYRTNGPRGDEHDGSGGSGGQGGDSGGNGGDQGGDPGSSGGDGGGDGATPPADPVQDPLAGLGPMMGGGMDPLAALGPALGSVPGMFSGMGGGGGGLPFDALGSGLGALGGLAGLKDNFADKPSADSEKPDDHFKDDPDPAKDPKVKDPGAGFNDNPAPPAPGTDPAHPGVVDPKTQIAPEAAAPVAAPAGDPEKSELTVKAGNDEFTAPDKLAYDVMRDVVEKGMSPTAAYGQHGVQLAPPGTPVTAPVDPNLMKGGELGYFDAQEPILAMGKGKIWLDGQVQPLSALGSRQDFLGWTKAPGAAARSGTGAGAV